jgi:hypothetical protein
LCCGKAPHLKKTAGSVVQVVGKHFEKFENVIRRGGYLDLLVFNYDKTPLINKYDSRPKLLANKFE